MSNTNGKELIDQICRNYNCTLTGQLLIKTIGNLFNILPNKYNCYFTYEVQPKNTNSDVVITWWFDNNGDLDWVECTFENFNKKPTIILRTIPNNQPAITNDYCLSDYEDRPEVMYDFIKEFILTIVGTRKLVRVTNNKPMKDDVVEEPVTQTTKKKSVTWSDIKETILEEIKTEKSKKRISWNQYFMEMCDLVAKRSTCIRRQVGAVIVKDNHILSTGYNGAPKNVPHCADTGGCVRSKLGIKSGTHQEICKAAHAEQNAIAQAACKGISLEGAVLYCNTRPCSICTRIIINAGITKVYYKEHYPDELSDYFAKHANLELIKLEDNHYAD